MSEFFEERVAALRETGKPFAIATVIAVRGSASAKPGSKALIDHNGKNIWGWVGGGCAESFVAQNAVEAMHEKRTRIVQADLDDEIFGLGMPCGGIMDVFIDPQTPPEKMRIEVASKTDDQFTNALKHLADTMGFEVGFALGGNETPSGSTAESLLLTLSQSIAALRGASFNSLRETKGVFKLEATEKSDWHPFTEFLIMGSSRITEELARFGALAKWKVRVYGWNLDRSLYPGSVELQEAAPGYADLKVAPGSMVIVASHHKGDHEFIQAAIESNANYVGLIASQKRSGLVFAHLAEQGLGDDRLKRIHAPAGVDLDCRQPSEIALSCVTEMILAKNQVHHARQ